MTLLHPYILGGALLGAIVLAGGSFVWGYSAGKETVLNRLKDDRITVFQDGVKIDNEVLGADDNALCDLLGGCS